jgi:hypothetical protein
MGHTLHPQKVVKEWKILKTKGNVNGPSITSFKSYERREKTK